MFAESAGFQKKIPAFLWNEPFYSAQWSMVSGKERRNRGKVEMSLALFGWNCLEDLPEVYAMSEVVPACDKIQNYSDDDGEGTCHKSS